MKKGGAAVLLATLLSGSAWADGAYLLQRCQAATGDLAANNPAQRAAVAYCFGLLQGVRELNDLYQRKFPDQAFFCSGDAGLGHRDSARLVVAFLEANPSALHQNETIAVVRALRDRYPCR